ncbi:DUF488 domain-containing protein [Pseudochrobactrum sp. HB0163]|uniref:DUF488 domain-containing protein n=1 Tax=Pseudochrobactrum sp. HB0163 TaxID=3450708 RepID=UPI003F6E3619
MFEIAVKRIYEPALPEDGFRVLVDRLWPRGFKKEQAQIDLWLKEIAPTTQLRQWFHAQEHTAKNRAAFRERYFDELNNNSAVVERLLACCAQGVVTLLYSARDTQENQAIVLRDYLQNYLKN